MVVMVEEWDMVKGRGRMMEHRLVAEEEVAASLRGREGRRKVTTRLVEEEELVGTGAGSSWVDWGRSEEVVVTEVQRLSERGNSTKGRRVLSDAREEGETVV